MEKMIKYLNTKNAEPSNIDGFNKFISTHLIPDLTDPKFIIPSKTRAQTHLISMIFISLSPSNISTFLHTCISLQLRRRLYRIILYSSTICTPNLQRSEILITKKKIIKQMIV